jgi:hypothetical protein
MTEPCDLSAVQARQMIGTKKLSPVELLESCIKRVGEVNHAVNAMVAMDEDAARAGAKEAEAAVMRGDLLGALHGLPLGIKDLDSTAGLVTTFGSPMFKDNVPDKDDHHVADLRDAGGIILGKTNTPEFGAGANTRNAVYGARPPVPPAVRAWRWRWAWCRWPAVPIPAAPCAIRRPLTASSASAPARGWCRTAAARWAGPASPCSARWRATPPTWR